MKVDLDNVEDKYKFMCKEEMTRDEIGVLGVIVLKDKLSNFKEKVKGLFRRKT